MLGSMDRRKYKDVFRDIVIDHLHDNTYRIHLQYCTVVTSVLLMKLKGEHHPTYALIRLRIWRTITFRKYMPFNVQSILSNRTDGLINGFWILELWQIQLHFAAFLFSRYVNCLAPSWDKGKPNNIHVYCIW